MKFFAETGWMCWITNCQVEINHPIKGSTGTNPLIHFLANSFSILAEVIGAFIWRQSRAKHPDSMLMCAIDQLLESNDELIGAYRFSGEWTRRRRRRVLLRRRRLQMRPSDIVNPFQNHHVSHAGLCEYIPVEARQRTHPSTVMPDAISTDSFIDDGQARRSRPFRQASRKLVWPIAVFSLLCSHTIGDRISECYEGSRSIWPWKPLDRQANTRTSSRSYSAIRSLQWSRLAL